MRPFAEHAREHPDDRHGASLRRRAAYLFAEFDRLHILQSEFFLHDENFRKERPPDARSEKRARLFEQQITKAQQLAAKRLAQAPNDTAALLATMLAQGLRSDYEGLIEERYIASLASTRKSRLTAEAPAFARPPTAMTPGSRLASRTTC